MIAVLVGTRPEIIKLAPVIRMLQSNKIPHILIHSGQHYSEELDKQIIEDLKLPAFKFNLRIGSGSHAGQTGRIMIGVEKILIEENIKCLVVHGDTNTMLAGSLAAVKLHIPIAHVEAGLRSFDNRMPEEINRIITDKISHLLFAPTKGTKQNLLNDGISPKRIFVTGNTGVDAVRQHLKLTKQSSIVKKLKLKNGNYILVTAHRAETVDDSKRLKQLILLLNYAVSLTGRKIIWPIHPRTNGSLIENKLGLPADIITIPPTNYLDMLALIQNAFLIMTDSGGIQEESYILQKPVVTLRNSTERPETLTANFLVDLDKNKFKNALDAFRQGHVKWNKKVLGKGNSAELIVKHLQDFLSLNKKA